MTALRSTTVDHSTDLALLLQMELCRTAQTPDGWTFATAVRAVDEGVTGDCVDIFELDDGHLGVLVLDVAGRGAHAALGAFRQKEVIKVAMRSGMDPSAAMRWLRRNQPDLENDFFSAFVAVLEPTSGEMRYANAGHPPALVVDGERRTRSLIRTGPIVGFVDPGWSVGTETIAAGEALAIYTDGLIETRNAAGDYYGAASVVNALATMECDEAQDVVDHLLADLMSFHDGPVSDDVTLLVLCRHAPGEACSDCS